MQKLILMRHAKSDWNTTAGSDFDRPLADRGRRDAPKMGAWLKHEDLVPDLFISSSALRAKQTAQCVAEVMGFLQENILWDERIYGASVDGLLDVINDYTHETGTLLLVGHNPGLDSLLEYLAAENPEYSHSGKLMTTAALAVLDFADNGISDGAHQARLEALIRPKELKK